MLENTPNCEINFIIWDIAAVNNKAGSHCHHCNPAFQSTSIQAQCPCQMILYFKSSTLRPEPYTLGLYVSLRLIKIPPLPMHLPCALLAPLVPLVF